MSDCGVCGNYKSEVFLSHDDTSQDVHVCARCFLMHVNVRSELYTEEDLRHAVGLAIKAGLQQALDDLDDIPDTPVKNHTSVTAAWRACRRQAYAVLRDSIEKEPFQ